MYPQLQVSCGSTVQSEEKSIWTDSWDAKLWEFPTCRRITLSICLTNKALCNTFWCNTGKLWRHHNLIAAVGGLLRSNTNINKTVAAADLNHYVGIKKDALGFFYFYRPMVFLELFASTNIQIIYFIRWIQLNKKKFQQYSTDISNYPIHGVKVKGADAVLCYTLSNCL